MILASIAPYIGSTILLAIPFFKLRNGASVTVKLEGNIATNPMMKDMTVGFVKQKLSDGTGRAIDLIVK